MKSSVFLASKTRQDCLNHGERQNWIFILWMPRRRKKLVLARIANNRDQLKPICIYIDKCTCAKQFQIRPDNFEMLIFDELLPRQVDVVPRVRHEWRVDIGHDL